MGVSLKNTPQGHPGCETFAVGITDGIDMDTLENIAGGDAANVRQVDDFQDFVNIANQLALEVCA